MSTYSLMDASISAMGAFGVGMMVTTNNIANINTNGFKSSRTIYEDGADGYGVQIGRIARDDSPGSYIAEPYAPGPYVPGNLPPENEVPGTRAYDAREGRNVSLEREFTDMISTQNAYAANAAIIHTADDVTGILLDVKI